MELTEKIAQNFLFAISAALFLLMLGAIELGRWLGRRRRRLEPQAADLGVGTVEGAVFALLGLLLAFTFSGSASRFDARRDLVTQEANAIGTAYLRVDLLPADRQPEIRRAFAHYVEARVETPEHWRWEVQREIAARQQRLWQLVVAALAAHQGPPIAGVVLDPINEMIDITTTRWMAVRTHPPVIIFMMLALTALASGLLAGYAMSAAPRRRPLHSLVMTLVVVSAIHITLDIEFPRLGMIRIDAADEVMHGLLDGMRRDVGALPP
jgi:hypothetical protein